MEGLRYHLRFSDCFDTLSRSVWCSNQWWEPTPPPGTEYVEDGVLHLVRRRSDGYPNVTVSSEPCGQARPQVIPAGLLRGTAALDRRAGLGPAFWLLSTAHATNPNWPQPACALPTCLSAEIDVFEGYGNHLDVFTGTIHRNSCDCYGEPSPMNSNNWQPQPGHEHVRLARLRGPLDHHERDLVPRQPHDHVRARVYDSTNQPMHLLFYNWADAVAGRERDERVHTCRAAHRGGLGSRLAAVTHGSPPRSRDC